MKRLRNMGAMSLAFAAICYSPTPHRAAADEPVGSTSALYRSVSPSVVTITVSARDGQPMATGSGVIVSSTGQILTNYHVVSGGVFFDVKVPGNPNVLPARALKCAPLKDLALLSIASDRPLRPARLAKQRPSVGARVVAVGSPLSLEGSITDGVVSQFRSDAGIQLIQTTTPISPGSSGGGLFTLGGELAGITTMTLKSGQALNFAVAIGEMHYLTPCTDFPMVASEDDWAPAPSVPTPTPPPTPTPCPPALKLRMGAMTLDVLENGYLAAVTGKMTVRVRGILDNVGCGSASYAQVRATLYIKPEEYIASRAVYVERAVIPPKGSSDYEALIQIATTPWLELAANKGMYAAVEVIDPGR